MKMKERRRRHKMRVYARDKMRGRLLRKGWEPVTVERTMTVRNADGKKEEVPIECEVFSHATLGTELILDDANKAQKAQERHLKETFDERAAEHLKETGWILTEYGQWYKPNWSPVHEAKQQERLKDTGVQPGYYGTLRQAYRMQLKLDSAPDVEGLEESLEDMMLMSQASEFGA